MKLFVILLVIGLSASEKLNRAYLPPPGAKFAGGSSEDLQFPLDYPKDTPIYEPGFNAKARFGDAEPQQPELLFTNGLSRMFDTDVKTSTLEGIYAQTTAYPRNSFETTVTPLGPKTGYENPQTSFTGFTYPINGHNIQQEYIPDSFGTIGHHLGKPGNMAIIAVPDVMQNYQPKAFGMYGGNPMIINSYLGSQQQQFEPTKMLDKNNENYPSRYLPTSVQSNKDNFQKPSFVLDATRVPLATNLENNPEAMQYPSTTVRNDKRKTLQNLISRNETQKKYSKRPKRPQAESDKNAELINYKNALTPEGYAYSFDTSNGIHKDESATTADGVKALGSYSYTGDDGKVYSVIYSADENGFQPRGDHFPTPPPIPEAIQMVIEQAKKDKEAGITHDGSYDEERYGHMKYQGPLNRYLKNKQRNYEMRNRKIVPGSKKMHKKTVAVMDTEGYNYQDNSDHGKNVQQSYVQSSVNKLNGQFGMKRVATVSMNEGHANNKKNEEKKYFSLPLTPIEYQQDNNQPRIHKPSANEYTTNSQSPKMNKNRRKGVQGSSFKPKNNSNIIPFSNMATNSTYENNRQVKTKLDFNKNPSKMTTPQDAGYLYIPPRNIFIEGKFQDKPTILNEAPNNDITYINVETKATVPVSQLYYIDHFDKNNNKNYQLQERPISKITTYTTTEEPINQPTYRSDFYGSTNRDVDQSTLEERNASEKNPSKGNNPTITTTQPYGNTLSTNYNDKDYTDNIHQQEDTLNIDNRDKNGFPSTSNDIENTSYQSTTPMPSHTKYTSQPLVDLNQYDTTYPPIGYDNTPPTAASNYPENEGYYRTSPDVPATFEDLPSSKYKSIYKVGGVQTEPTPSIKVDGFGRPIQDTSNSNFPNGNRYSTTGILMNDKNTDDKLRPAALYPSNFEAQFTDKNTSPEDDEIGYPDDVSELERASASDYGNKKIPTDGVIGEDFSGPKQQQRYDPETGYYY